MPNTEPRFLAVLCVRDEGAFLLDWLAHHRAVGFTDFLVVSNDCRDGTDAMLDRLAALGWLTHVRNDGPHPEGPQWSALKIARVHPLRAAADWVMVLDIDEYVNIHAGDGTLPALLAALPAATAIPLTWRLFGNGGVVDYEDRPVTETFTRAAPPGMVWPWRASLFKTLFRDDGTYGRLGVHRPRRPDPARIGQSRWFGGDGAELPAGFRTGRIFSPLGRDQYRIAQINHYALGSMQGYVLKCDRGRANREAAPFDLSYWIERNFGSDEDLSIARYRSRSAPLRAELAGDAALAALHAAAVAWRHARFEALMPDENFRALFGRLLMAPESRPLDRQSTRRMMIYARLAEAVSGKSETDPTGPGD